ncbi:Na+/H+ antiporter subunit E [Thermobifida halotolerans]|uniref:Na+/H+ antiporter subunit E n=1 Tax=Thermobifida halotolerans TaxID=483545 RepID=A0A399FYT2_9ACTN|nr:Na+/H+ antiporter subunit E [Thermobifida halotolerans]UOE19352.1 Na+/H+ antiporter subunit E [Thermobifida halotolerans]
MRSLVRAAAEAPGRVWRVLVFLGYFLGHLVEANAHMAREILTPRSGLAPGIVRLDLRARTEPEISVLANLISLTPKTLVIAVRREPPALWIHGTHAADPEEFRTSLRTTETRLLAAMRRPGEVEEPPEDGPRRSSRSGEAP